MWPNMRVQRTRSSASPPHSPLTRWPLGRGSRWLGFVVLAAATYSAGCSRRHDIPVSNLPPELAVPKGATDVMARGDGKSAVVEYRMSAPYPAGDFLTDIASRLAQGGWKATETDFLNPTISSSNVRGWTAYLDGRASPPVGVHQWLGQWRNNQGDVVSYALRYSSAAGDPTYKPPLPTNSDLRVTAFLIPAGQAEAMAAAAKRIGAN